MAKISEWTEWKAIQTVKIKAVSQNIDQLFEKKIINWTCFWWLDSDLLKNLKNVLVKFEITTKTDPFIASSSENHNTSHRILKIRKTELR